MKSEHNKLLIVIITAMTIIITDILITYHVPGTMLSALSNSLHLIFIQNLSSVLFGPHSTGEESKI